MTTPFNTSDEPPELDEDASEEEEGTEEEEDGEEEVIEAAPPRRRRSPKERKNGVRASSPSGGHAPPKQPIWQERDVELLWPEILRELGKPGGFYASESAHNVEIRVRRVAPPPGVTVGRVDGVACVGEEGLSPGEKLVDLIDDYCHIPTCGGAETRYEVYFVWKAGVRAGQTISHGPITRPTPSAIYSARSARMRANTRQQSGPGMPQTMPMPQPYGQQPYGPYGYPGGPYGYPGYPVQPQMYPPPYGYPPPGLGAMPQQGQQQQPQMQHPDPMVMHLIGTLTEQLNETRRELAEARGQPAPQPVTVPIPPPAPPQQQNESIDIMIARGVAAGIRSIPGLGAAPQGGTSDIGSRILKGVEQLTESLVMQGLRRAGATMEAGMRVQAAAAGEPEPAPDPNESHAAEVIPQEDPKENLPFQQVTLEGKWANGQQVVYTPSKDGTGVGGIHLGGFVANNPFVLEKLTEAASAGIGRIMESMADLAQRAVTPKGPGQQPHVVSRTPSGAVDATDHGVAGNPVPPPPPPPPPAGSDGGWPTPGT